MTGTQLQPAKHSNRNAVTTFLSRGLRRGAAFLVTFATIHWGLHFAQLFGLAGEDGLLRLLVDNWQFESLQPTGSDLWWLRGAVALSLYVLLAAASSAASRLRVQRRPGLRDGEERRSFSYFVRVGAAAVIMASGLSLLLIDPTAVPGGRPAESVVASYLELVGDGRFLDAFERHMVDGAADAFRDIYLEALSTSSVTSVQRMAVRKVEAVQTKGDEGYVVVVAHFDVETTRDEETTRARRIQHFFAGWIDSVGWRILTVGDGCPDAVPRCESAL